MIYITVPYSLFRFQCIHFICFGFSLFFCRINDKGQYLSIWRNKPPKEGNANVSYGTARLAIAALCNADLDKPIRFEVLDELDSRLIGQVETTLHDILEQKQQFVLNLKDESGNEAGNFVIYNTRIDHSINMSEVNV
jgi:hypothetical protein